MKTVYDVFARRTHPEPLAYIGSVEVNEAGQAARASLEKFGPESEWLEMVIVPHQKVIRVFPEPKENSHER
jgi:hypothetical protein